MQNRIMNERGWFKMDMMERSQSLNREALLKLIERAFHNRAEHTCASI